MKVIVKNIRFEVEDSAEINPQDPENYIRPVVLLIMGLGMQLTAWPASLVHALVDAGYRVIRMDNRDVGLSEHLDGLGTPNLFWAGVRHKLGLRLRPAYTLHDMATDALGVLDALDIPTAHVVGASMGGMVAQRIAMAAPQRVASLTSIMSSSGAKGLPRPKPEVVRAMMRRPANNDLKTVQDHFVKVFQAIGSPGFPTPEAALRERIGLSLQRSYYPAGTQRQLHAVMADDTRFQELGRITSPCLVLHGDADPLLPIAHGQDTAQRIPGARFVGIEGMGHDLPDGVLLRLMDEMVAHLHAATPVSPYHTKKFFTAPAPLSA